MLTLGPTATERADFVNSLSPDYGGRVIPVDQLADVPEPQRFRYVSCSTHLRPEANTIKLEIQDLIRKGPTSTRYLTTDWRQRTKDTVWSLLSNPEMILIP